MDRDLQADKKIEFTAKTQRAHSERAQGTSDPASRCEMLDYGKQAWRLKPLQPPFSASVPSASSPKRGLGHSFSADGSAGPIRLGAPLQRPSAMNGEDKYPNQVVECEEALILNEILDAMLRRERAANLPPSYIRAIGAPVRSSQSAKKLIRKDKSTGAVHGVGVSVIPPTQRMQERTVKDPVLERFIKQAMLKAERLQKLKGPAFEDKLAMSQQVYDLTAQLEAQSKLQHDTALALEQECATTSHLESQLAETSTNLNNMTLQVTKLTTELKEKEEAFAAQSQALAEAQEELEDLRDPEEADVNVDPLRRKFKKELVALIHELQSDKQMVEDRRAELSAKNDKLLAGAHTAKQWGRFQNEIITHLLDGLMVSIKADMMRMEDLQAGANAYRALSCAGLQLWWVTSPELLREKKNIEPELDLEGDPIGPRFNVKGSYMETDTHKAKICMDTSLCRWANRLLTKNNESKSVVELTCLAPEQVTAELLLYLTYAIDAEALAGMEPHVCARRPEAEQWEMVLGGVQKLCPALELDKANCDVPPFNLGIILLTHMFVKLCGVKMPAWEELSMKEEAETRTAKLAEVVMDVRAMKAASQSLSTTLTEETVRSSVDRVMKCKKATSVELVGVTEEYNKWMQLRNDAGDYLAALALPYPKRPEVSRTEWESEVEVEARTEQANAEKETHITEDQGQYIGGELSSDSDNDSDSDGDGDENEDKNDKRNLKKRKNDGFAAEDVAEDDVRDEHDIHLSMYSLSLVISAFQKEENHNPDADQEDDGASDSSDSDSDSDDTKTEEAKQKMKDDAIEEVTDGNLDTRTGVGGASGADSEHADTPATTEEEGVPAEGQDLSEEGLSEEDGNQKRTSKKAKKKKGKKAGRKRRAAYPKNPKEPHFSRHEVKRTVLRLYQMTAELYACRCDDLQTLKLKRKDAIAAGAAVDDMPKKLPLTAFVRRYFQDKYGLERLALQQLRILEKGVQKYYHRSERLRTFAVMLGIRPRGQSGWHFKYLPNAGLCYFRILSAVIPNFKSVGERLGHIDCEVRWKRLNKAIGQVFSKTADTLEYKQMIEQLEGLTRVAKKGERKDLGFPGVKVLKFDVAMEIVMARWMEEHRMEIQSDLEPSMKIGEAEPHRKKSVEKFEAVGDEA